MSRVFQWNGPGDPWAVPLDAIAGVRLLTDTGQSGYSCVRVSTEGGVYETATIEDMDALRVYEQLLADLEDHYDQLFVGPASRAPDPEGPPDETDVMRGWCDNPAHDVGGPTLVRLFDRAGSAWMDVPNFCGGRLPDGSLCGWSLRWEGEGIIPTVSAPLAAPGPDDVEDAPIPEETARLADGADQLAERVRRIVTAENIITDEEAQATARRILDRATHPPMEEVAPTGPDRDRPTVHWSFGRDATLDRHRSAVNLLGILTAEGHAPVHDLHGPRCGVCDAPWPCTHRRWIDQLLAEVGRP